MGTVTSLTLIAKAAKLLQDETYVRWPKAELLAWLNDAQREIVLHRPESSATTEEVTLTAGTTLQNIPLLGVSFIRLVRNKAGSAPGAARAIRIVSREIMDAQNPDWHSDTSVGYVKHYIYDPLSPRTYYVYPQVSPSVTQKVELIYAKAPTDMTVDASAISVDDIYANAMLDYTLFRAYSKDAEYAQNAQLAIAYYTAFANAVGLTTSTAQSRNPNLIDGGMNPNVPRKGA